MKMETTFYHDMAEQDTFGLKGKMNMLRSQMTLDFNNAPPAKRRAIGQLLASPDLNMLKLASPELERMIIQHNGMVTTTPTPTQILFPKSVTEEQEAYARGFMDALAKLHNPEEDEIDSSVPSVTDTPPKTVIPSEQQTFTMLQNASNRLITLQNVAPTAVSTYNFSTTTSLPDSVVSSGSRGNVLPSTVAAHSTVESVRSEVDVPRTQSPYVVQPAMNVYERLALKEEPQTVPSLGSTPPVSPMMSPINMDEQETQKIERKRSRNRVAARKCRYRKLERISRLEERVNELKSQNNSLSSDAGSLKEQVLRLKKQILEHVNSGCNIMMTANVL